MALINCISLPLGENPSTDLENVKTKMRSTVSVREGQGVVLLCGPPTHSGGKNFPNVNTSLLYKNINNNISFCQYK